MRKDLGAKPIMYPMPVLVVATYNEDGTPEAMTAAWGGIADSDRITLALSASHRTVANMVARRAFTVSMGTASTATACDYVGIVSGNDVPDKFSKAGFHATGSPNVDAPLVDELPLALECRLLSYDGKTETALGQIVSVQADESILTDGKVDVRKLDPICYDTSAKAYLRLGDKVGDAFSDGKRLDRKKIKKFEGGPGGPRLHSSSFGPCSPLFSRVANFGPFQL